MKHFSKLAAIFLCIVTLLCFVSCGEEDLVLPPHQHKYTYVVYPSSCSQYGHIEYNCACRDTYTEELTTLADHAFTNYYITDREPTYTTEGEQSRHCLNCDARTDITTIPKLEPDIPFGPV